MAFNYARIWVLASVWTYVLLCFSNAAANGDDVMSLRGYRGQSITLQCPGNNSCPDNIRRKEWQKWWPGAEQDEIQWPMVAWHVIPNEPEYSSNPDLGQGRTSMDKVTGDLTFTELTAQDDGRYKCEFTCQQPAEMQLNVLDTYSTNVTYTDPGRKYVTLGKATSLSCGVTTPGIPNNITGYSWLHKDRPINDSEKYSGSTTDTLIIYNVMRHSDDGRYQCLIENEAGTTDVAKAGELKVVVCYCPEVLLDPIVPANTVKPGIKIAITCRTNANPPPINFTLLHDGKIVDKSITRYLLDYRATVYEVDAGNYTCQVCNEVGCASDSTVLHVQAQQPPGTNSNLVLVVAVVVPCALMLLVVPLAWLIWKLHRNTARPPGSPYGNSPRDKGRADHEYEDIAYVTQEATREKHRQPQTTEGSPIADSKSPPIPESIKERIDAIGNGVTPTDGTPRVHTEDSPTVGSEGYPLPYSNEERIDGTASGVTPKKDCEENENEAQKPSHGEHREAPHTEDCLPEDSDGYIVPGSIAKGTVVTVNDVTSTDDDCYSYACV